MKSPYIRHTFGDAVATKLRSSRGWLTAGVASSIPWPSFDVCIEYAGDEYFLRGSELDGKASPPCITIACNGDKDIDAAIGKVYRFTSILSWFAGGYVDVSGYLWSSHPVLYGGRTVFSSMGIAGSKSFNCNHMPVIEDENVRKALAFWREGKRLDEIHDSYAFLSFYKVIESQFRDGRGRGKWITDHIDQLTDRAGERVAELRAAGVDVSEHLFDSGRCAVAHASLDGEIVDPDIPADRKRLSADLVVIEELARIYIRDELKVPDSRSQYRTRDRLVPWDELLSEDTLTTLRSGGTPEDVSALNGLIVAIGIWPDGPILGLARMTMHADAVENGVVRIVLLNERRTVLLVFWLDYRSGRIHTNLEDGGLLYGEDKPDENDVRAYATFFFRVFGNGIAELTCGDFEPIDCEVVIPLNMMMTMSAEEAIEARVEQFRKEQIQVESAESAVLEPPKSDN
ncbi:methylamine utilization protein MauJ [Uliginosibacterium sp. H1]|uniref:methylamine utilization protein MauJ n=1 Tax=Uliginosibacterium sp. H1 TaxID=3114757 RepID=UPI002E18529D|nr:methylamine utilization protein MauJ [Uliginosibacterium sp. H1]